MSEPMYKTIAEEQFHTSSLHNVPKGYTAWSIRNDYPPRIIPPLPPNAPWLTVDPTQQPKMYLELVKEYCFEGMINNDFVPQDNKVN